MAKQSANYSFCNSLAAKEDRVLDQLADKKAIILAHKSWTAYVAPVIAMALFLIVSWLILTKGAVAAAYVAKSNWQIAKVIAVGTRPTALIVAVAAVAVFAYRALLIKSHCLYMNRSGVWMYRGVWPWDRRAPGVFWHELGHAAASHGFWEWAFHSHTLYLTKRYGTTAVERAHSHIHNADVAVAEVNAVLQTLFESKPAGPI